VYEEGLSEAVSRDSGIDDWARGLGPTQKLREGNVVHSCTEAVYGC
jgi:hypothetical protein